MPNFGSSLGVLAVFFVVPIVFFVLILAVAKRYKKVGPNQVMVISGRKHKVATSQGQDDITGFGAGGIVANYVLHWTLVPGLGLAAGAGLVLAGAAFFTLELIFSQTQAGSEFDTHGLAEREAEVTTSIPESGTGEIAYLIKGQRKTLAARASDGAAIKRGQVVVIERVTGSVAHVRAKS